MPVFWERCRKSLNIILYLVQKGNCYDNCLSPIVHFCWWWTLLVFLCRVSTWVYHVYHLGVSRYANAPCKSIQNHLDCPHQLFDVVETLRHRGMMRLALPSAPMCYDSWCYMVLWIRTYFQSSYYITLELELLPEFVETWTHNKNSWEFHITATIDSKISCPQT